MKIYFKNFTIIYVLILTIFPTIAISSTNYQIKESGFNTLLMCESSNQYCSISKLNKYNFLFNHYLKQKQNLQATMEQYSTDLNTIELNDTITSNYDIAITKEFNEYYYADIQVCERYRSESG